MRLKVTGAAIVVLTLAAGLGWYAMRQSELLPEGLRAALPSDLGEPKSTTEAKTTQQGNRSGNSANGGRGAGGPVAVEASKVRQATKSSDIRAVGSLQSDESVQIASEIAGRIADIPFKEGQPVKSGDIIVRLDEALAKAEVADAQARLTLATANNDRARTLSRTGIVTGRSRDEAVSNFETSNAALELAQTRLEKHTLKVPFDGVAGVRGVSVGAYVGVGVPIVNIEKIDTLKVDFKVPEIYLEKIKVGQKIEVLVDALPDKTFTGEIYAINPQVDVNGRALQIRARLANPEMMLRPGLFARIVIKGMTAQEVTLVPESAIVPRGGESFVYKVENGQAIESRVKLGERKNAEVEILEGLAVTATVVTAGQQKLRNGAPVEIVTAKPAAQKAPDPGIKLPTSIGRSG
ncbi:MAG: efflux transporter periplasmic adaptor subunit [Hyphomicrobium sp.]|nr:MAG: efflux transporter periplasmic adaptor subunit [Hyphomicrobium sp.]PPD01621.1 MAG: efflux transporter periplasmic adaptor subunit [Hyphomicrobium sp.]